MLRPAGENAPALSGSRPEEFLVRAVRPYLLTIRWPAEACLVESGGRVRLADRKCDWACFAYRTSFRCIAGLLVSQNHRRLTCRNQAQCHGCTNPQLRPCCGTQKVPCGPGARPRSFCEGIFFETQHRLRPIL